MNNTKNNTETTKAYTEHYQRELQRKVDLIYNADVYNPEAWELWKKVKDETWIKPEIREKWESKLKEIKEKGIEINN